MFRITTLWIFCLTFLAAALVVVPALEAQQEEEPQAAEQHPKEAIPPVPPAPIPAQIITAKKVFISNAPGYAFGDYYPVDHTYNQFYALVKDWRRYELVSSPAEADLVIEISLTAIITAVRGSAASGCSSKGEMQFRVTILDPKTRISLWWFSEPVQGAFRRATLLKNVDMAMTNVVGDLKKLTTPAVASAAAPDK